MKRFQFKKRIWLIVIFSILSLFVKAQDKLPFDILSCKYENTSSGVKDGGKGQEYFIEIQFNKKTEISFDSASANGLICKLTVLKNGEAVQRKKFKKKEKVSLRYGYFRREEIIMKKKSYLFYTHQQKNLVLEMNDCERIKSIPRP